LIEKTLFRPLTTRPKEAMTSLIAAVGLAWVLQMLAVICFGELDRNVPSAFKGIIHMGGVVITKERLATIIIAFVLVLLLNLFLLRTRIGMAIRAVAQDKEAAALQGIQVGRISSLSFGIGCALAGAAGVLMAPIFCVSPFLGGEVILKAFLVVILGEWEYSRSHARGPCAWLHRELRKSLFHRSRRQRHHLCPHYHHLDC
jgi:branched-chain amino acid transport system permease protein